MVPVPLRLRVPALVKLASAVIMGPAPVLVVVPAFTRVEIETVPPTFNVPEALQWGLIHEAAPAFELDDRVTAIAMHLSQMSPQAIGRGLEFVQSTYGADPVSAAPIALKMRTAAFASTYQTSHWTA